MENLINYAAVKKLGYQLVVEDDYFVLYKDKVPFPVLVTDSPIVVADWLIENA